MEKIKLHSTKNLIIIKFTSYNISYKEYTLPNK